MIEKEEKRPVRNTDGRAVVCVEDPTESYPSVVAAARTLEVSPNAVRQACLCGWATGLRRVHYRFADSKPIRGKRRGRVGSPVQIGLRVWKSFADAGRDLGCPQVKIWYAVRRGQFWMPVPARKITPTEYDLLSNSEHIHDN